MIPSNQPAKTYDLNILASVLGRCNTQVEHTEEGRGQIKEALEMAI